MIHDPHRTDGAPSGQARSSAKAGERIAKALARAGVASRREVERLIAAGRVALNGHVLTTPAVKVAPGDILTVDGKVVSEPEPTRLFRYHKPVDLVTSHADPQGRPTVFDALPPGLPRLISVGRLDINSEGLLLLTNDGGLARALELPTTGLVRRYRARARGRVTQERLDKLKAGITVEGVAYGPIEASLDKAKEGPQGANLWITITLAEGKNREVRRVLEALGLKVNRLIRLAYGPLVLGTLSPGEIEEVGPRVIREQLAEHIAPENLPKGDRPQFTKPMSAAPAGPRRGAVLIERGHLRRDDRPARAFPGKRGRSTTAEGGVGATPTRRAPSEMRRAAVEAAAKRPAGAGRFDKRARPAKGEAEGPAKKAYKPGWAKPKPAKAPGSKRAGAPPSGPRGRKPSASPPRSSGARRPGPPRSGGPKPRG